MYANQLKSIISTNLWKRRCHSIYNNHRLNDFPQTYALENAESGWYEVWEKNKLFSPDDERTKSFRMILPPPNITGTLHLGHALTVTVQDILARWHRMNGASVLWVPGLDHAGIATQAVVEKYLHKTKGIKRSDMAKEEFLQVVDKWKNEKSQIIEDQLKTLGASLDWLRLYFTISDHHNQAVTEAFITLDKRNLLFREKSLINWSSILGSALSDIEVEFETLNKKTDLEIPGYDKKVTFGQIYEVSYNLKDSNEKITVATTRPETLLGDVALAVHPDDTRYTQFIGKQVKHPLKEAFLPIIADKNVKMDFGTGVVKITPAHDEFDYSVAKNHNLEIIQIINEDGKLTDHAGTYKGLPRFIARRKILTDLANLGCLRSVNDHKMEIPRCSRTGDIVELLLKEQWFINCKQMASKALKVVENGSLKFDPAFHEKTWHDWLSPDKIRNWCVSRQLWWGHKIPAYYYEADGQINWIIAKSKEEAQKIAYEKCGVNSEVQQDSDVLDTWFSSALLPFSSLGWPTRALNYKKYYPLNLMETGHDILFFWVARMVMLGLELTNELPFKEVLLHGVLCDAQGKKMSKSRGNVIFPENILNGISLEKLNEQAKNSFDSGILNQTELKRTLSMNAKMFPNGIPKCSVDALRFTLCSHNIKERNITFDIVECEQNNFFCNKIWQASRYVLLMTDDGPIKTPKSYASIDLWIRSRLAWMVETVNREISAHNFSRAVAAIRQFVYYEFCDYYVEGTKLGFKSEDQDIILSHRHTLSHCLEVSLRVLAPITPYLCDDLYSKLAQKLSNFNFNNSLLESPYPTINEVKDLRDLPLESKMKEVINVILSMRTLLGSMSNKRDVTAYIVANKADDVQLYLDNKNVISGVSKIQNVKVIQAEDYKNYNRSISDDFGLNCTVHLVFPDDNSFEKAKTAIENKRLKTKKKLEAMIKKFSKTSEEGKLKFQEKVLILEKELKRIPVTRN